MKNATTPMTADMAGRVYQVLIEECRAPKGHAISTFINYHSAEPGPHGRGNEWRFGGILGMGGKFWTANNSWYVNCYSDDADADTVRRIKAANARLSALLSEHQAEEPK